MHITESVNFFQSTIYMVSAVEIVRRLSPTTF